MKMFAAVDLGANSFRMHVGVREGNAIRIVNSLSDPVSLGAGFDARGCLTEAAQRSAIASLSRFREALAAYPLDAVRVVATSALRSAKNAALFLGAAEKAVGYPIEVISGEEEGRLIYMGVASALPCGEERRLVLDIGGGSTELALGQGNRIERVESFSIGTIKQSLAFFSAGGIDAASIDAAIRSACSYFEDGASAFHPRHWRAAYGSSGTTRNIAAVISENRIGDGSLNFNSLQALKQRFIEFGHVSRVRLAGLDRDRIPGFLGALTILIAVMREVGFEEISEVDAGLRMGVLWDLQLRASRQDRREQSVLELMARMQVDTARALRASSFAGVLYARLKPAKNDYHDCLRWSALLHEVGLSISHTGFHKHGAYLAENADLAGFTSRERRAVGALILAQKGNLSKVEAMLADADFAKAVLALRLAVMFMHSRTKIDVADVQIDMRRNIEIGTKAAWANAHPSVSHWLEKEAGFWEEIGVPFSMRVDMHADASALAPC